MGPKSNDKHFEWTCVPHKSYVGVLTRRTSECSLIWKQDFSEVIKLKESAAFSAAPAGPPKCPGERSDTHGDTDPVEGSCHSDWLRCHKKMEILSVLRSGARPLIHSLEVLFASGKPRWLSVLIKDPSLGVDA